MINQEVLNFILFLEPIFSDGVRLVLHSSSDWGSNILALLACFAGKTQTLTVKNHKTNFAEFFFMKKILLKNATFLSIFREIDMEVIFYIYF